MTQLTYSQTKGTHEVILGINFEKWMKKKDSQKDKKEEFAKKHDVDSTLAKMQAQLDSLQIASDH